MKNLLFGIAVLAVMFYAADIAFLHGICAYLIHTIIALVF